MTDKYTPASASLAERQKVKHVTVLYQGSETDFSKHPMGVVTDWIENDFPIAGKILGIGATPVTVADKAFGIARPTPQLATSEATLKQAMAAYPNAHFEVYGHSLGSMDAQYAMANLSAAELKRLDGGYVYEGPNIYSLLSGSAKRTADMLRKEHRVWNFVDSQDIIPLGYFPFQGTVGWEVHVASKSAKGNGISKIANQHMWGGYQFTKDGALKADMKSVSEMTDVQVDTALKGVDQMRAKLIKAGHGHLTTSQKLFLDAIAAHVVVGGYAQLLAAGLGGLDSQLGREKASLEQLWCGAKKSAETIGPHLSESQRLDALSAGGVTHKSLVTQPNALVEQDRAILAKTRTQIDDLLSKIQQTIDKQAEADSELRSLFA